jgi:pilus assembly protein CpaF
MIGEETVRRLREQIREQLDAAGYLADAEVLETVERAVFLLSRQTALSAEEKRSLVQRLYYSFRGLDVLQPLVDDPTITEIMINSHEEIFIEQHGAVRRADVRFDSRERLDDIIQLIVGKVNRIVNEASPIVDARLSDGSRVNVVLPPVALKGPTMTIRKFPERAWTLDDLVRNEALTEEAAEWLKKLVRAKYNLFISGGTSSGKTTLLNALADCIPQDERVITIEDSAELQIRSLPNLVSLETRNANTEGRGEITIRQLIRTSLRMRPDRIIIGEVRGEEAFDMLQAMNTGHAGSLSTGHANGTADMIRRLETMVLSGASLPIEAIRRQISSAVDVMVHLSRLRDRTRRVTEISEVAGYRDGEVVLNPLYQFVEEGERDGKIVGRLQPTGNSLCRTDKLRKAGL